MLIFFCQSQNCFSIDVPTVDGHQQLILRTNSEVDCKTWIEAITKCRYRCLSLLKQSSSLYRIVETTFSCELRTKVHQGWIKIIGPPFCPGIFSFVNVCRMVLQLCYLNIFSLIDIVNKKRIHVQSQNF